MLKKKKDERERYGYLLVRMCYEDVWIYISYMKFVNVY